MGILTTVLSPNSITTPQHSFETRSTEPRHSTQHLPYLPLTYCAVVNAIVDVFCCFLFSLLSPLTYTCIDIFSVLFIVLFMRLEFLNLYIKKFPFLIYGHPTFLPISCAPDVRFASKTHHCNPLESLHKYAKQNNTWKSLCRSQLLFIVCPTPHALYPDFFGRKARVPFFAPENVMYS